MRIRPVRLAPMVIIGVSLLVAACGGAASGGDAHKAPAAKVSPAGGSIGTAVVTVAGQSETVLTDSVGRTLYLFTPEKDGKIVTTADVLRIWQPLLLPNGGAIPTSKADLPGKLGAVTRPEGTRQVSYNEWPLYTYAGDKEPGSAAGQGVAGQWFVVQSVMPADADNDADGTRAAAPPQAQPAPAAPTAPTPVAPPTTAPSFNDRDSDNNGGVNDGDGNG
jgi:predicted lipoprotein with Yx(FWY)xxD motif